MARYDCKVRLSCLINLRARTDHTLPFRIKKQNLKCFGHSERHTWLQVSQRNGQLVTRIQIQDGHKHPRVDLIFEVHNVYCLLQNMVLAHPPFRKLSSPPGCRSHPEGAVGGAGGGLGISYFLVRMTCRAWPRLHGVVMIVWEMCEGKGISKGLQI